VQVLPDRRSPVHGVLDAWEGGARGVFRFFGGVPARLVPEYVPRNIFVILCPVAYVPRLC
jgi:hypothetical protein